MILVCRYIIPKGYCGITIFPFIFLTEEGLKKDAELLNHERIHLRQQLELLIVIFYIWYVVEFLIRLLYCGNWERAYRSVSFEREAYTYEFNLSYMKKRPIWAFLKFVK